MFQSHFLLTFIEQTYEVGLFQSALTFIDEVGLFQSE